MNNELYEYLGYVPESSFEDSPVGAIEPKKVETEAGAGVGTPNSECDFFESSPVAQSSFSNTPPPRSILKPSGFMTPGAKKKVVFKKGRKSLSCDVTPRACSPAYLGRNSITRAEMADIAFCLEKTLELSPKNNSPAVQSVDQEPEAGSSRSGNNGKSFAEVTGSSKSADTFQLSALMMQLSCSPIKTSSSKAQITRLG